MALAFTSCSLFDFCRLREFQRQNIDVKPSDRGEFAEIALPREMKVLALFVRNYPQIVAVGLHLFKSMRVVWPVAKSEDQNINHEWEEWGSECYFPEVARHWWLHLMDPLSFQLNFPAEWCFNLKLRGERPGHNEDTADVPYPATSSSSNFKFLGSIGYVTTRLGLAPMVVNRECVQSVVAWLAGALANGQRDASLVCLQTLPRQFFTMYQMDASASDLLRMAAVYDGLATNVILLHSLGADVNNGHLTPLLLAAYKGHLEVMKVLHSLGADVNAGTSEGFTPVHVAAERGHLEVVKLLHSLGADVKQADKNGVTPVYRAAQEGHFEVVRVLESLGADVNAANSEGFIPVHVAADKGHLEVVKVLHSLGADVNKVAMRGLTPLSLAIDKGHLEIVEVLHLLMGYRQGSERHLNHREK